MSSDKSQCCDCGHICCIYRSGIKCSRNTRSDNSNKGVDGCKKCEYWMRKIQHGCDDMNQVRPGEGGFQRNSCMGLSEGDAELSYNTGCSRNNREHSDNGNSDGPSSYDSGARSWRSVSLLKSSSSKSESSRSSSLNKRSNHIPRFGSKSRGIQNGNKNINISDMVNFHETNSNKNKVIFTSNSLTKNSSTIPCDSISDQYGRKIWSWSLSPPASKGIMTNYDGINANAGIDIEGKYVWAVNFYTLPLKSNDDSLETPDLSPGGTIKLNLSLCIHKGESVTDVELIKEYTIIHKGDEPNYHYVELGDLDIKSGIVLILLRRVADDDIDEVYPNNIYIIGLTGTEK